MGQEGVLWVWGGYVGLERVLRGLWNRTGGPMGGLCGAWEGF